MNIFEIEFEPIYPVPSGLLIVAHNEFEALEIAKETITHTDPTGVKLIKLDKPKVIFYESGDY